MVMSDSLQNVDLRTCTTGNGNVPNITDAPINIAGVKALPALVERYIALARERSYVTYDKIKIACETQTQKPKVKYTSMSFAGAHICKDMG